MPRRSTIVTHLPPRVRRQLEKRLIDNGFSGYRALTRWLRGLGYPLSLSAVHLYGRQFAERCRLHELAKVQIRELAASSTKDELTANSAVLLLLEQQVFALVMETQRPLDSKEMARLAKIVSSLTHTTISHQRWAMQVEDRLAKLKRDAAGRVAAIEQKGGLSPEAATAIRDILLGLNPFSADSSPSKASPS